MCGLLQAICKFDIAVVAPCALSFSQCEQKAQHRYARTLDIVVHVYVYMHNCKDAYVTVCAYLYKCRYR